MKTKTIREKIDANNDVELYLRMTTAKRILTQFYESTLVQSMKFFWPANFSMVVVLDKERQEDHVFGEAIQKTFPFPRICFMGTVDVARYVGLDRMQRDMFYPERCTSKKYVAFVDTDTMFISRVVPEMLFDNHKPIIIGIAGNLSDDHQAFIAQSTLNIFKTKEVMRCMANFPVIFKVEHIINLRKYIEKIHNSTFDEVLILKRSAFFSQFHMMCQYIWMFHRDEYSFRLSFVWGQRTNLTSGRVDSKYYDKMITEEQRRPAPRLAVHYKHVPRWKFMDIWRSLLASGICFMGGFELCPEVCKPFNKAALRNDMFIFERVDWRWDKRCLEEQRKHYQQVAKYASENYTTVLRNACSVMKNLNWTLVL